MTGLAGSCARDDGLSVAMSVSNSSRSNENHLSLAMTADELSMNAIRLDSTPFSANSSSWPQTAADRLAVKPAALQHAEKVGRPGRRGCPLVQRADNGRYRVGDSALSDSNDPQAHEVAAAARARHASPRPPFEHEIAVRSCGRCELAL